jgi:hypothetical protein
VKIRGLSCEAIRVWGTEIDLGLKSSDLRREGKWNRLGIWDLGELFLNLRREPFAIWVWRTWSKVRRKERLVFGRDEVSGLISHYLTSSFLKKCLFFYESSVKFIYSIKSVMFIAMFSSNRLRIFFWLLNSISNL